MQGRPHVRARQFCIGGFFFVSCRRLPLLTSAASNMVQVSAYSRLPTCTFCLCIICLFTLLRLCLPHIIAPMSMPIQSSHLLVRRYMYLLLSLPQPARMCIMLCRQLKLAITMHDQWMVLTLFPSRLVLHTS